MPRKKAPLAEGEVEQTRPGKRGAVSSGAESRAGWVICDRGRRYIYRSWPTLKEASRELRDLLKPYPRDHEWRHRLHLAKWDGKAVVFEEIK